MLPDSFCGGETHEEAEEDDDKLFRGYGRAGKETRGQSDRYVEAGNTSNRVPESLSPHFKDQIKRSFGRPPEAFEATSRHHFTQAFFPGLCTQGQPHFLRE